MCLDMSHFSYSCKTKLENGFSRLFSQNGINWTGAFLLNIHNAINWTGAFSKAFSSSEALILVLSKNARLYDELVPSCLISAMP